jgi:hypothetical protein
LKVMGVTASFTREISIEFETEVLVLFLGEVALNESRVGSGLRGAGVPSSDTWIISIVGDPRRGVIPNSLLLRNILMIDLRFSVSSMASVTSTSLQITNKDLHSSIRILLSGFRITPGRLAYPATATQILVPLERSYRKRQV